MILGAIPGAAPDKWVARWRDRYPDSPLEVRFYDDVGQLDRVRGGTVDVGYIRQPQNAETLDKDIFHRVLLYTEDAVVCAASDHWIAAAATSLTAEEIADEARVEPAEMLPEGAAASIHAPQTGSALARAERLALETVAAGAGVVVLPASVARMLARKDVVIRPVDDMPGYQTGLAWLVANDSDLIQDFIGVARGRRPGSARSTALAAGAKTRSQRRQAAGRKPAGRKRNAAPSSQPGRRKPGPKPRPGAAKQGSRRRRRGRG